MTNMDTIHRHPAPPKTPPPVPLKCLSPEELALRRERGLCFNCDEQFHRGHKCVSRMFLLIADEEDANLEDPTQLELPPDPLDATNPTQAQITLHSLSGHLALETLCLLGHIATHQLVNLVDGGSTHNFIQEPLV